MSGTKAVIAITYVGVITGFALGWFYPEIGLLWRVLISAGVILGCNLLLFVLSRMPMCYRSLAFVVGSALIVAFVMWRYPTQMVDFGGHGYRIGQLIWLLLFGLAFTHLTLLGIMWVQRGGLKPSEAAMFRWTGEKAIFWGSAVYLYRPHEAGVLLRNLVLFVLLFITTLDLDVKLFRRYILGVEDRDGHLLGKGLLDDGYKKGG